LVQPSRDSQSLLEQIITEIDQIVFGVQPLRTSRDVVLDLQIS